HCDLTPWEEPDIDEQTNRVRLSYSWNFERGDFNKKPGVHEESPLLDPNLKDTAHAARINKWNTETLEFKLIKDDTTAHKLAQYYLKNITKQLKRTSITTEVGIGDLDAGEVVKVTSPRFGWSEKEFVVTSIKRNQEQTTIEVKEYSASVYVFTDPGTGAETSGSQYSPYNIPAKPTMSSLAIVNEKMTDGTIQTRVDVVFVKPTTNVQLVALYFKPVGDPDTSFRPLDFTVDATRISALWKGVEAGNYNFRLVSISSAGIYSDIAIESGDKHYYGQPGAESFKTMTGDVVAPGTPTVADMNPIIGGVSFYITVSGGIPDDFSHFKVYRKIGIAAEELLDENWPSQLFSDTDRGSGYAARTYAAIAVDTSGNESAMSAWSASSVPLQVKNGDIEAESVTTEKLTAQQIIAKDFRSACNVGNGVVSGVMLTCAGFQAWNGSCRTVNISNTGNVEISGTIYACAGCFTGTIYACAGCFTGCLYSCVGNIGGWCVTNGCIHSASCGIILTATGIMQTGNFVTGNSGWKIDCIGNAEFNNVCARGSIRTAVFIKDEISVVGGHTMIRPAVTLDCFAGTYSAGTCTTIYSDSLSQFAVNDIVRVKDGLNDSWGRVTCIGCSQAYPTLDYMFVIMCSGTCGWTPTKGQAVVNYGCCCGCGGICMNGQAPYIDLYTHAGSPWAGTTSRVRIGNLNGWGTLGVTYGIAVGCPTGQYMTYDTVSGILNLKGAIIIGSSGIANFSDAGALATVNNLDGVPNGVYSAKTYLGSSLINNYSISNNLYGWPTCSGLVTVAKDGVNIRAHAISTNQCVQVIADNYTEIDPSHTYKFSMSLKKDIAGGTHYIGLYVYDCNCTLLNVWPLSTADGSCGTANNNFYFVAGVASAATWVDYEMYIMPSYIAAKDVPRGLNSQSHAKVPANAKYLKLRYLNWSNAAVTRVMHVYSPSLVNVDTSNQNAIYRGLSTTGALISRVVPACTAAPSGAGLYLGSDYMGYYDGGAWKTFMNNTGCFYLGGTSGGLQWNGSALTVCGTVCATSGCFTGSITSCLGTIGGWTIGSNYLHNITAGAGSIYLCSAGYTIFVGACTAAAILGYTNLGRMYYNGAYLNAVGFSVGLCGPSLPVAIGVATLGTVALPSGTTVAATCPFFYVGSGSTAYMQYYDGVLNVKGVICATSGTFTGAVCATSGTFTGTVCASAGTFTGTVCTAALTATCGTIGGWSITPTYMCGTGVYLYPAYGVYTTHAGSHAMHGKMYDCNT
ncbi:MAG: hypothetical protein CVU00_15615, partial [Bacteroidetes bacterium HGW-Bacteroidetes-17]